MVATLTRLIVFWGTISLISCTAQKKAMVITGDLYFKLVDFRGFYGASEAIMAQVDRSADSLRALGQVGGEDRAFLEMYDGLKKYDMLQSRSINLRNTDGIVNVYLSEPDYAKFKDFNHNDLLARGKKVYVKIEAEEITRGVYIGRTVTSIALLSGETGWHK